MPQEKEMTPLLENFVLLNFHLLRSVSPAGIQKLNAPAEDAAVIRDF